MADDICPHLYLGMDCWPWCKESLFRLEKAWLGARQKLVSKHKIDSVLEKNQSYNRKAIENSVPSYSCDRCAPHASSDASVYTMSCFVGFGYRSIGAWITDSLSIKKAFWRVGVHSNVAFGWVKSVKGLFGCFQWMYVLYDLSFWW